MANEPIDEHNFVAGVNVVDIGDLRVSRGLTRRPASSCSHAKLTYCERERRMWCRDCQQDVEAFDAFVLLVGQLDRAWKDVKKRREALDEAERFHIRSIAAKTVDKAWRHHKAVPACPCCGHGLFPEDFKHDPPMLSREYAEARRKKLRQVK